LLAEPYSVPDMMMSKHSKALTLGKIPSLRLGETMLFVTLPRPKAK